MRLDPQAPGGFLVHSFCGDGPLEAKDYVRDKLGLPFTYSKTSEKGISLDPLKWCAHDGLTYAARSAQALRIWAEAMDPHSTPVESYLRRRGLDLPRAAAGEAIHFHPTCPFAGSSTAAMVCLVRDILTNEPKAIHRTALTAEGHKGNVSGHDACLLVRFMAVRSS
ncbi:hypothetical protein KBI52_06260 [Microvirga sp. HBU67558]|uniref:DUF7146 domain-containing protein n=1 Tax=Microvirga TaxID=186650 RepID=UPI001B36E848|nr:MULTISPECIES: hypothetical protein [unclassified Microvirga]MBQ0819823.1 hypothetical protein [Microvirga sp. HBU67558]